MVLADDNFSTIVAAVSGRPLDLRQHEGLHQVQPRSAKRLAPFPPKKKKKNQRSWGKKKN